MKRRQSDDRYPGDYGGYDDQGYDRYDGGYDDSYDDGSGFQDDPFSEASAAVNHRVQAQQSQAKRKKKKKVRITVIATGFKANTAQSAMDFSRKDNVFNSTTPRNGAQQNQAPQQTQSTYQQLYSNEPRFADEDYIPDFLKRQ